MLCILLYCFQGQERQERLQRLLAKYLLRRRKDNTIPDQLPQKTDNIVFCKMTRLQSRAYKYASTSFALTEPDYSLLTHFFSLKLWQPPDGVPPNQLNYNSLTQDILHTFKWDL